MRMETIKGIKVKVFAKKDLMDKLGFSEDEAKVVMKYQKTFPELLQDDLEGFVIDARELWEQLDKPYAKYADWIKRKVMKSGWVENTDFSTRSKKIDIANGGNKELEVHYFTTEMAKNVCMMENTDKGMLTRKYFILIEKALRKMDDWIVIREPQKEGYKKLCKELNKRYIMLFGENAPNLIYANEADMLNICLLGARAKEIRKELDIPDNKTRDWLTVEVNKALFNIQTTDSHLVLGGVPFEERKNIIETICRTDYKELKKQVFKELNIEE